MPTRVADIFTSVRSLLRHDVPASLVVFLVAIPLSLGIASAAGAPLIAGLVAAVVGGVVAGALGGAPLQVSGPAAGLTIIVAQTVHTYGWPAMAAITVAAGVVQVVLGVTKLGRAALSLSPAIVHGMLAGIGLTIAIGQIHVVLGGKAHESMLADLRELPTQLIHHHSQATLIGAFTVAVLLCWPRLPRVKAVPAPLVALVSATLIVVALGWKVPLVNLPDNPLNAIEFPQLPHGNWTGIVLAIGTVAAVASVQALLSAVAVDKLHEGPRANLDRELVAQGLANLVSGSLGGFPVTGVIVRGSANVGAGARSRASAILHGLWIAAFAVLAVQMLELIPLSVLAAILVVVGVRLIKVAHMRDLLRHHELSVYLATGAGVALLGVVQGVLIGVSVAIIRALYRVAHATIRTKNSGPGTWHVTIHGSLIFWAVGRLVRELRGIPHGQRVTVELHTDFIDHASYEALTEWIDAYHRSDGKVIVDEIHGNWYKLAAHGRPEGRKHLPAPPLRWFAPWSQWQQSEIHGSKDSILAGMREFEHRNAPLVRPFLEELGAHGQHPKQLFITCVDSRVVPNVITSSGPGDLLCVRNVANVVPAHGSRADASVGASIEFAVQNLGVTSIVVCGHSTCGGVQAALAHKPRRLKRHEGHLERWIGNLKPSLVRYRRNGPPPTTEQLPEAEQLCVVNVAQQLQHLRSYPYVRSRIEEGKIELMGVYFDISDAKLHLVDENTCALTPLTSFLDPAVPAVATGVLADGVPQGQSRKVRKLRVSKDQLGIGGLPEQEIGDPLFSGGADEQIDIGEQRVI